MIGDATMKQTGAMLYSGYPEEFAPTNDPPRLLDTAFTDLVPDNLAIIAGSSAWNDELQR